MTIRAEYRSECIECGYDIHPGDLIELDDDFGWAHVRCVEEEPAADQPCPTCHLIHAGECM